MSWWRELLAPARRAIVWASLGGFFTVAAGLGLMGTSAYLISRAALRPPTLLLLLAPIAGVRFFAVLRAGGRYGDRVMTHDASFRSLSRLKVAVFTRLSHQPPFQLLELGRGDWLRRMSADVDRLGRLYTDGVGPFIGLGLVAGAAGWWLVAWDPAVGWVSVAMLLLVGAVVPLTLSRTSGRKADTLVAAESRLATAVVDAVEGLGDLLSSDRVDAVLERMVSQNRTTLDRQRRLDRREAILQALVVFGGEATGWLVLAVGVSAVVAGRVPGFLVATLVLVAMAAFEAVRPLAGSAPVLGEMMAAGHRVLPPETARPVVPVERPKDVHWEVEQVGVRYQPDGPWIIRGATLSLGTGQHGLIMGPSGSGKSTLAAAMARLVPYQAGALTLGGVPLPSVDEGWLRSHVAVLLQRPYLFQATVRANLRLGERGASDEQLWDALAAVDLADWVRRLPRQLDTPVGELGRMLSGGERRRLALAQLLLADAAGWILDEPLADLDPATAARVAQALHERARQRTVLVLTHDPLPFWTFARRWRMENGILTML